MSRILPVLCIGLLLGGCAVYPDGSIGPLPPAPPAGVYVPPPAPPVAYAPPVYGYGTGGGVPVYVVPQPAPVYVAPSVSVGIGLGWGRGYFDKTLGSMENRPPVYAVVYDSEVLDEIPTDLHDQPVDGIVTPTQTITLSPARH